MIEYIKGKLISKKPMCVILESHGIAYNINTTLSAADSIGNTGEEIRIITHLHIKDNPLTVTLYGFSDETERECFRQIISVSGIGPKTALSILSAITYNEFTEYINTGRHEPLLNIPGIGRKTAERLVLELKGKLPEAEAVHGGLISSNEDKSSEIMSALIALGYSRTDADRIIRDVARKDIFTRLNSEEIIKEILRGS